MVAHPQKCGKNITTRTRAHSTDGDPGFDVEAEIKRLLAKHEKEFGAQTAVPPAAATPPTRPRARSSAKPGNAKPGRRAPRRPEHRRAAPAARSRAPRVGLGPGLIRPLSAMARDRYEAKRWCSSCQCEQVLDLIVEPDAVLAQCLTCLSSFSFPRVAPDGQAVSAAVSRIQ